MAERLMRRAHRGRSVAVDVHHLVVCLDAARRTPQRARRVRGVFDITVEHRRRRNAFVANPQQLAVLVGAERNRLDRCRLMSHHRIHLGALKLQAHGALQDLGREHSQQRMWPDIGLAAEPAAKEMRHYIDPLRRETEHDR